jgi:hypothetical protein
MTEPFVNSPLPVGRGGISTPRSIRSLIAHEISRVACLRVEGPGGEPGVDAFLRCRVEVTAAGGESGEELDTHSGGLLGVEERGRTDQFGPGLTPQPVQQVPAREAVDDLPVLGVCDLRELRGQPALESRQVRIPGGRQPWRTRRPRTYSTIQEGGSASSVA